MQIDVAFENMTTTLQVDFQTPLGMVQKALCRAFHQSFPQKKAILEIKNDTYDEFIQQPFSECSEGTIVTVRFQQTDDPFFYDCFDRNPDHIWLR